MDHAVIQSLTHPSSLICRGSAASSASKMPVWSAVAARGASSLAEQAAQAAQAFRETLQRATLAAEALALPDSGKP